MNRFHESKIFLFLIPLLGCSVDSARNHYVLAEKLWEDKNYAAAVTEFEKVVSKDPKNPLGILANYRAAMTQYLFLSQYSEAIRKLKTFVELSSNAPLVLEAQLHIGDILFSKLEYYDQAIAHYQMLLQQYPDRPETSEWLFRKGKSQFYLFQFQEALKNYKQLKDFDPSSQWAEKAEFEIGITYLTAGDHLKVGSKKNTYEIALETFQRWIQRYPQSASLSEAHFAMASCYEELDRLEEAIELLSNLKKYFPSPNVIEIKLNRIQQRIEHRKGQRRFPLEDFSAKR